MLFPTRGEGLQWPQIRVEHFEAIMDDHELVARRQWWPGRG
jgi:hypothetical protein